MRVVPIELTSCSRGRKHAPCTSSAARAPEPKHPAIPYIWCQAVPRSPRHFSDHTTLVCRCCCSWGQYEQLLCYGKLATGFDHGVGHPTTCSPGQTLVDVYPRHL